MSNIIWSRRYAGQHDSACPCAECESYWRNEARAIDGQIARGEWNGNTVVTGHEQEMATVERLQKALSISARQVHEAFLAAEPTARPWEEVTEDQKVRYQAMALRLNGYLCDAIRLHVATQATGYVWSAEEE